MQSSVGPGFVAALRLTKRPQRHHLRARGKPVARPAAGFKIGDAWLEKFYHHIFRTDTAIVALIDELRLGAKLPPRPRTVTLWGGQVYQLDSPATVLQFPPLSLIEPSASPPPSPT
ncbi:MAG: hypothetical protein U0232_16960 [Thermomicrobiales bacterium]